MSNYIDPLSPVTVSSLIATDVQSTALGGLPAREQLAEVISEVQLQSQTLGASLLRITLIDPGWAIQRTGWLNVNDDGLLDEIEVEFPKGAGMWWRLAMVEGGNDLTQPNLTLTFQDRIVAYLQDKWGPIGVAPHTTTRAQFIKQLVDQVGHGDGLQPIDFVCPEINQIQLVANTSQDQLTGTTIVNSSVTKRDRKARINKLPGITNISLLTTDQVTFVQQLSAETGLDPAVVAAWCLAEESGTAADQRQADGNENWLNIGYFDTGPGQITQNAAFHAGPQTAANQTALFLKGLWGGASASIRAILGSVNQSPMAQLTAIYTSNWASSHYNNGKNLLGTYQEITGVTAPGTSSPGGSPSLPAVNPPSDVKQLTRGTADNPDESSWECMQRLAQEVNWYLFSNGNHLYYMDGVQFGAQTPAVYLLLDDAGTTWTALNPVDGDTASDVVSNLTYTFDNTAFQYQSTHKRKGKIQRKTGVRTPQTPSQIKLNMICGVLDYRAGDVFVFRNSGVIDGRWIVQDATRNCLADRHTQFTLGPPVMPNLEPAATTTGANLSGKTPKPSGPKTKVTPSQPGTSGNARTPSPPSSGIGGVWYPPAKRVYAPKLDHGPRNATSGVVIHVNGGGTYAGVVDGFAAGGFVAGVGAHFEIGSQQDGPPVQFLPLDRVAWHAGNANGFSIGIEHAGLGASRQEWVSGHGNMLATSAKLTAWILKRYDLGPPVINTTSLTAVRADGSPAGNIWPHNLGLLDKGDPNSWGGHVCPDGPDGVDYFPWETWGLMVAKEYQAATAKGEPAAPPSTGAGGPTGTTTVPKTQGSTGSAPPSLWNRH